MNLPGFSAEASLYRTDGSFQGGLLFAPRAGAVIPAIPKCDNRDWILNNCSKNGWRPRAVCDACYFGNCYDGPS